MKDNPFRRAIASRKQLSEPILTESTLAEPAVVEPTLAEFSLEEPISEESKTPTQIEPLPMPAFSEIERPLVLTQPETFSQATPTAQSEIFPKAKLWGDPEVTSVPEPVVQPKAANFSKPYPSSITEDISSIEVDVPRKRGRPATGKRSDGAWVGRTYYIKRETDLDIGEIILQLRRQGIEVDKSELVDLLLSAWVKWHKGENMEIHLSEVSPIQK